MNTYNTGKDLFIVDNSVSGWTGLRYLEEWTEGALRVSIWWINLVGKLGSVRFGW
jgi:hypothetical protein